MIHLRGNNTFVEVPKSSVSSPVTPVPLRSRLLTLVEAIYIHSSINQAPSNPLSGLSQIPPIHISCSHPPNLARGHWEVPIPTLDPYHLTSDDLDFITIAQ